MINKKIVFLGILLLLIVKFGTSQIINSKDYLIISFELIQKEPKNHHFYYWITPIDSINNNITFIYPLYTEEYSKDNYEKCIKGDTVDIFTTTKASNFDFSKDYISQLEYFLILVKQNKLLIQNLEINWDNQIRKKEKVNIYVTPIKGEFCKCIQETEIWGNPHLNFVAQIFMPVTSFNYSTNFWKTEVGKVVQFIDFTKVDFASHLPYNLDGKSALKVRGLVRSTKADL